MTRGLIVGLAGLLAASMAHALPGELIGHGAATCAQFLTDHANAPVAERVYFAWAQGYMSAILITRPVGTDEQLDLAPPEFPVAAQLSFLSEYCVGQKESHYSEAVETLYLHLRTVAEERSAPRK